MTEGNGEVRELPQGWVEVSLKDLFTPNRPRVSPQEYPDLPFIGMEHISPHTMQLLGTDIAKNMKSNSVYFYRNDVLYGRLRPYLNKVYKPDFEGLCSAEFIVFPKIKWVNEKYIQYLLNSAKFVSFASHLNEGDRPRVDFNAIGSYEFFLPPLAEQERIVEKIEELFSDLDQGIESLKTAKKQLKVYRQAVLKWAFEGKLTEEWRKQHSSTLKTGEALLAQIKAERENRYQRQLAEWETAVKEWEAIGKVGKKPSKPQNLKELTPLTEAELIEFPKLPDGWCWIKLGQAFGIFVGSTPSRKESQYWDGSINWVSSGEVQFCKIYSTKERITELGLQNTSTTVHPPGTVILGMIGEGKTRGQAAILKISASHNQNTAAIRIAETNCYPELLYQYFYYQYQKTREIGSGNNQKALNKERVENMVYPLFSIDEQERVIEEIESRLSICDQLETAIIENLQKAEALRQSILKQAFEGKLVPQDPNDEPAEKLLERIKAERQVNGNIGKKSKPSHQQLTLQEL